MKTLEQPTTFTFGMVALSDKWMQRELQLVFPNQEQVRCEITFPAGTQVYTAKEDNFPQLWDGRNGDSLQASRVFVTPRDRGALVESIALDENGQSRGLPSIGVLNLGDKKRDLFKWGARQGLWRGKWEGNI